ncbi:general transcription factor II-I repeat domain-containing protein 2-like [Watersipora subatra]|uniref:general transcription factor II-I repeat domain-containing protein 2-like n=1 Tax=Watersipora subatra TaxID=2589382 RepID=UPI00355B4705
MHSSGERKNCRIDAASKSAAWLKTSEKIAINKVANVKRHYTQNHLDYDGRFPPGTARRQEQLDRLTRQANGQMAMMRGATSLQQRAATAGYELSVFVRYYLNNKFSENLAAVIPLTERMTGEDIYQAFKADMDSHKVSMHKIISVATDGTPAMESDSQYGELLVHNNARWLSKGRALQGVCTVRQHIELFLSEIGGYAAERFLEILRSENSLRDMAFLTDILAHLYDLNLKLQGESCNVVELWQAVTSFKDKLHCFYEDINSDTNHFPIIREFVNGRDDVVDLTAARAFLIDISSEMERRFAGFDSINGIIELAACPFQAHQLWKAQVDNLPHVQTGVAELELCDLKADILAKAQFAEQTIVGF